MVSEEINAATCRALEGGYMNTKVGKDNRTCIRNSSIYLTDAISCEPFVLENRFHNNLYLATTYAKANNLNVQNDAKETGLMPYNYEYDKSMKVYSLTIDLTMIGKDENFNAEADNKEKAERVIAILNAVENLNLVVKGNLDNAEPLFVIGGLSDRMTHRFENVVNVHNGRLVITKDLKDKLKGYSAGLLEGDNFENELEIIKELNPVSITEFFNKLRDDVKKYYEV
jgi:CRISPR-associated protein Cst2